MEVKAAQLEIEQEKNCSLVSSLEQQIAELTASRHQVMGLERIASDMCTCPGGCVCCGSFPQGTGEGDRTSTLVPRMRYMYNTRCMSVLCSEFWSYLSYGQCPVPRCPDKGGLSVILVLAMVIST